MISGNHIGGKLVKRRRKLPVRDSHFELHPKKEAIVERDCRSPMHVVMFALCRAIDSKKLGFPKLERPQTAKWKTPAIECEP